MQAHKAGSHAGKGWETFTAAAIRAVVERKKERGVVFMAWGNPAQKVCERIGIDEVRYAPAVFFFLLMSIEDEALDSEVFYSLLSLHAFGLYTYRSAHPSPLSAHRGFIGNGHFRKANEWLRERYGEGAEINWAVLGRKPEEP